MLWLVPFIVGWFGTLWPGAEVDAPPKGPLPEPWWWRILIGAAGGLVAIGVLAIVRASSNPMPGLVEGIAGRISSDPMPGLVIAVAAGAVTRAILAPLGRGMLKQG